MKKLWIVLALFVMLVGSASALIAPSTMVSGKVTDSSGNAVSGAFVSVICQHGTSMVSQKLTSSSTGKYYAFWKSAQCTVGDKVYVVASKSGKFVAGTSIVTYNNACKINTATVNLAFK